MKAPIAPPSVGCAPGFAAKGVVDKEDDDDDDGNDRQGRRQRFKPLSAR